VRGTCGHRAGTPIAVPSQLAAMGMHGVEGRVLDAGTAIKALVLRVGERSLVADEVVLSGLGWAPEQVPGSGEPGAQAVCR
jgi:hypothetical protein